MGDNVSNSKMIIDEIVDKVNYWVQDPASYMEFTYAGSGEDELRSMLESLIPAVSKIQDEDIWYWLPDSMIEEFLAEHNEIKDKWYFECPGKWDAFFDKYKPFRSLSVLEAPEYFKTKEQ